VSRAPVLEVVDTPPRLDRLPLLTSWPEDGGPFVTLPLVYTAHPDGKGPNLGMYRLHVHDAQTTGMHWQIGKGRRVPLPGRGGQRRGAAGDRLPRRTARPDPLGHRAAPRERARDDAGLAHRGRAAPQDASGPGPHPLVADAEFALIGHVPPRERRPEGPFGDHYGYYSLRHDYPVFRVQHLAHRKDAIYPATVVGKPRQEDFFIGDLLQELLSPLFPLVMPAVEALWSYGETGYHSLSAAVVKQRYAREAMASAFRILGEGQLSLTKFLLVTDRHVDLKDFRATLEHVLARTHPETDLYVFANLSMDTLDYTGPEVNKGSKGVWLGLGDAVRELPGAFEPRVPPPPDVSDVRVFCRGCLVAGARAFAEDPMRRADGRAPAFAGLAARRPERRARPRGRERHELPVDDVHALRAGARRPRGRRDRAAQPPLVHRADRHRRAAEARVSGRALLPRGRRRDRHRRWREYFPAGRRRDGRQQSRAPRLEDGRANSEFGVRNAELVRSAECGVRK
jgi:4-hydroxybenzoate decarboxylase subunit C